MIGDENVTFENYVLKAASKAFTKVFDGHDEANVSRVTENGLKYFRAANEKQLSSLGNAEEHEGLHNFGADAPASQISIS